MDEIDRDRDLSTRSAPDLAMEQTRAMLVGVVAALLALGLALYAHAAAPDPVFTPLVASEGRLYYLGTLLAAAIVGWLAMRGATGAARRHAWIMPALIVFAALWLAGAYHRWPVLVAAPLLAGSGVFAALFVRYLRADGPDGSRASSDIADRALTVIIAYVAYSVVLLHHGPAWYTAPLVGLVAALLCAHWIAAVGRRLAAYALIVGCALAQVAWAFAYWQATGWQLGAAALAIWYGMTAVVAAEARGELDRATLLRHGGMAALVFIASAAWAV